MNQETVYDKHDPEFTNKNDEIQHIFLETFQWYELSIGTLE